MRSPPATSFFSRTFESILGSAARCLAWVFVGFALAVGLMSCGGGGGEGGVSGGGTGGGSPGPVSSAVPAISFGPVVGLGSIFVGGFEFDDAPGKVTAQDGFPIRVGDLGVGVQVSVLNERSSQTLDVAGNNTVSGIEIKRLFMGVLQKNGKDLNSALVNGQLVYFDRRTVKLGAPSVFDLQGKLVQIAGYLEPTLNQIIATRIEPASAEQIAQNQIYITARVQSVDEVSASVSVGFATVSLAALQPAETIQVNDVIRVQGSLNSGPSSTVTAAKLIKIRPIAGFGGSTFRGIVNSRPTPDAPNTPLIVDGYDVQIPDSLLASLINVRRGSLVEVTGTLDGTVFKNARLAVIDNPKVTLPGEKPVNDPPPPNVDGAPAQDYRISSSPVQSVNADGSFVVRGVRVVPDTTSPRPVPKVVVGQIVSLAGEALADADGFYIFARLEF